jgi:hypothetical protein
MNFHFRLSFSLFLRYRISLKTQKHRKKIYKIKNEKQKRSEGVEKILK